MKITILKKAILFIGSTILSTTFFAAASCLSVELLLQDHADGRRVFKIIVYTERA